MKGEKRNNNFITTIIFTKCSTTLPVDPTSKKVRHLDVRVDPPNLVFSPRYVIYTTSTIIINI